MLLVYAFLFPSLVAKKDANLVSRSFRVPSLERPSVFKDFISFESGLSLIKDIITSGSHKEVIPLCLII